MSNWSTPTCGKSRGTTSSTPLVCLGNSFGYLELDGLREFAAALGGAVRHGGGLVVDFAFAAESVLPGYRGEPRTMRTGDITVLATSEYDVAGSRMLSRYRFTR